MVSQLRGQQTQWLKGPHNCQFRKTARGVCSHGVKPRGYRDEKKRKGRKRVAAPDAMWRTPVEGGRALRRGEPPAGESPPQGKASRRGKPPAGAGSRGGALGIAAQGTANTVIQITDYFENIRGGVGPVVELVPSSSRRPRPPLA